MTKAERRAAIKRSALWGAVIGIVPGMIALILGVVVFRSAIFVTTVCYLIFPLIALVPVSYTHLTLPTSDLV